MKLVRILTTTAALLVFASGVTFAHAGGAKKPTEQALKQSLDHQSKGNMLDEQGNTNDAIEEYKAALTFDPDDTNTLFNMGTVFLKVNKPEDAVKVFERVIKIDTKDTEAYNLLGLAYRGCGKKEDAIKVWEKSLSIDPSQAMPKKFIEEAKTDFAKKQ